MAKVAKRGIKRYRHAYRAGYTAGIRRAKRAEESITKVMKGFDKAGETVTATRLKENFHRAYPKVADAWAPPTDTRIFKWEGFVEAMNLIIASKR